MKPLKTFSLPRKRKFITRLKPQLAMWFRKRNLIFELTHYNVMMEDAAIENLYKAGEYAAVCEIFDTIKWRERFVRRLNALK